MAFRVEVSPRAYADLDAIAAYISTHGSFERAQKWFNAMIDAIASLQEMPQRCQGTGVIQVLHVRHWAQHGLSADEVQDGDFQLAIARWRRTPGH